MVKDKSSDSYSPKYPVMTLEKALDIIDILSQDTGNGVGISELSRRLDDMGKSTIHRILDTLIAYGYVDQISNKGNYRLNWKLYEIGNVVPRQRNLGNFDTEILQELCDKYQETVNFGVRVDRIVMTLYRAEPQSVLMAKLNVGGREPMYATSMGKVIMSEMDADSVRKIFEGQPLEKLTQNTITDIDDLIAELKKIREQGYAIDNQEYCVGLSCIAMPVRNFENEIVAAVSLSGPSARMDHNKIMDAKEELQLVSKKISEHLGVASRK